MDFLLKNFTVRQKIFLKHCYKPFFSPQPCICQLERHLYISKSLETLIVLSSEDQPLNCYFCWNQLKQIYNHHIDINAPKYIFFSCTLTKINFENLSTNVLDVNHWQSINVLFCINDCKH